MNVLNIEVSPRGSESASRHVSQYLIGKFKDAKITTRDLDRNPLPHVNGLTAGAFFTPVEKHTPEQAEAIKGSDDAVQELLAADVVVISTPMWNFGMPSVLKAWIDHIVRPGKTFSFGPEGLKALVSGKKVYVVVSSGSVFSEGPFAAYDQISPSIKTALGFIGMTDVTLIRVEGTNNPATSSGAFAGAKAQVDKLF
jgi:FMN-dependent NADH-azoreductase